MEWSGCVKRNQVSTNNRIILDIKGQFTNNKELNWGNISKCMLTSFSFSSKSRYLRCITHSEPPPAYLLRVYLTAADCVSGCLQG